MRRSAYLKQSLERLRGLNRAHLEAGDQLNYDLYLDLLADGGRRAPLPQRRDAAAVRHRRTT